MDQEKHQHFAEKMVRDQVRVFGYILSLIPNRADAEEVFQQTSLTLWENWHRYDPQLDFFPWACGFAYNHVRNFVRKNRRKPMCLDADVVEALAESGQLPRIDARIEALRDCVEQIPDRSREVIERHYEGESVGDIAKVHRLTENAVYKLLRRSRELLHDCITQRLSLGAKP